MKIIQISKKILLIAFLLSLFSTLIGLRYNSKIDYPDRSDSYKYINEISSFSTTERKVTKTGWPIKATDNENIAANTTLINEVDRRRFAYFLSTLNLWAYFTTAGCINLLLHFGIWLSVLLGIRKLRANTRN